jgi:hypothetical protein
MAEQAGRGQVPPILLEEIAASIAVAGDHCAGYEELGRLRDEQALLESTGRWRATCTETSCSQH